MGHSYPPGSQKVILIRGENSAVDLLRANVEHDGGIVVIAENRTEARAQMLSDTTIARAIVTGGIFLDRSTALCEFENNPRGTKKLLRSP